MSSIGQARSWPKRLPMMTGWLNFAKNVWPGLLRKRSFRSIQRWANGVCGFWMRLITNDPRERLSSWAMCTALRVFMSGTPCRCSPSASVPGVGHCHWRSAGSRRNPIRMLTESRNWMSSSSDMVGLKSKRWP